ncbi:hypothetical protein KC356_g60 [Hortaea werneckii]|nr:hypothetical protein KC356_g60 [Hortaea werneckii]
MKLACSVTAGKPFQAAEKVNGLDASRDRRIDLHDVVPSIDGIEPAINQPGLICDISALAHNRPSTPAAWEPRRETEASPLEVLQIGDLDIALRQVFYVRLQSRWGGTVLGWKSGNFGCRRRRLRLLQNGQDRGKSVGQFRTYQRVFDE